MNSKWPLRVRVFVNAWDCALSRRRRTLSETSEAHWDPRQFDAFGKGRFGPGDSLCPAAGARLRWWGRSPVDVIVVERLADASRAGVFDVVEVLALRLRRRGRSTAATPAAEGRHRRLGEQVLFVRRWGFGRHGQDASISFFFRADWAITSLVSLR